MPRRKLPPPEALSPEAVIRLCQQVMKAHYQCQIIAYQNRLARFNETHWPRMTEAFCRRVQNDPALAKNPDALIRETIAWVEKTVS